MNQRKQKISFKEKITGIYVFLLFSMMPLIVHHGYTDILTVKTGFFYVITGAYVLLMLTTLLVGCLSFKCEKWHIAPNSTEICLTGFGIIAVLSWIFCGSKKEQFIGIYGRNMGLLTIMLCITTFFLVSKWLRFSNYILTGILVAAAIVCLIAFLNHIGFDPLSMYVVFDTGTAFMSTMGNINTLAAYIGLVLPFGMVLFCVSESKNLKLVYGTFCFVGFLGMIAANSDSAYLTVGITFCILLYIGKSYERGFCLLALVFSYSLAGLCTEILRQIRGVELCMVIRPGLPKVLLDIRLNLLLAIIFGGLCVLFLFWKSKNKEVQVLWIHLRRGLFVLLLLGIIYLIGMFLLTNFLWKKKEAKAILGGLYRYFHISDNWGTKRFRIWKAALNTYGRIPFIKKCIGVGPAGFYFATQEYLTADELEIFAKQGNLIDAHNVYLQQLVLFGIIGLLFFVGIFISAGIRFWKKGKREYYMLAFAVLEIAFLVQAVVNNSHIYIDPLMFMLTAVGQNLYSQKKRKRYPST